MSSVVVPAGQVWIPWSMLYVAAYEESKRRCVPSHIMLVLLLPTCDLLRWLCALSH